MPHICVFDVNETLLDLRALDPHFARTFGEAGVRRAWFTQLLQSAFVSTITGDYKDFGTVGSTALDMVPHDQEIVVYCRGPYCVFADEAVTLLRSHGFAARRLDVGVPEWRRLGLPVSIPEEEEATV